MAEYTTLEQVKIRLKQFHIDSKSDSESPKVVFDHLEENPLLEQLISQAEADIRAKKNVPGKLHRREDCCGYGKISVRGG